MRGEECEGKWRKTWIPAEDAGMTAGRGSARPGVQRVFGNVFSFCPDVFSLGSHVFSFPPDVFTFRPNVSSFRRQVSTFSAHWPKMCPPGARMCPLDPRMCPVWEGDGARGVRKE